MKRKYLLIAFLLAFGSYNAQNGLLPEPTTSAFSSYINTPASPATGIPDVGIPLYQLETGNKNMSVNVALSYHVYNSSYNIPASEVGAGWSLFKSGIISRTIKGTLDEIVNWSDTEPDNADVFYYTLPGHSGKFKVYRDSSTGNMVINNITGERIKIECERNTAEQKFIINSFKITDDNGVQYFFQDSDLAMAKPAHININYKSAFVLTKISDENDNEIVTYLYDKKTQYLGDSTTKKYEYNKLKSIITRTGKIKFEYGYDASDDTGSEYNINDPYRVSYITLTDTKDRIFSRYELSYGGLNQYDPIKNESVSKKSLSSVKKQNKLLITEEATSFQYDSDGSVTDYEPFGSSYFCPSYNSPPNPKIYTQGVLEKITFPTKGYVVYNYEANEIFKDKTAVDYSQEKKIIDPYNQYYAKVNELNIDTHNTKIYTIQVPVTSALQFEMAEDYMETDIHGNDAIFDYTVSINNTIVSPMLSCQPLIYELNPGTYTVKFSGGGNGVFKMYSVKARPKPYRNVDVVSSGARIKNIRSFDADGTLTKSKSYQYDEFGNSLNPSGNLFNNEDCTEEASTYVLYKNVKETDDFGSSNNGYTKYYFKTPYDYTPENSLSRPFYNLTSSGVLAKKEIYNKQNQVIESSDYEYLFENIADTQEYSTCAGNTRPAWVKNTKETRKSYFDSQQYYTTISETTFSPFNHKELTSKTTDPEGNVTESVIRYATDTNNQRFISRNIISTALEGEKKINGTLVSKMETRYDNTSNFYPTSIVNYDLAQNPETSVTFDLYDSKGNLVQSTDKGGISTTTIWGYHQTLPIAQIVGAKYNDLSGLSTVTNAIAASDADDDNAANEPALLAALENLRKDQQLKNAIVTLYTHNPLTGITHILSPNGIKTIYEYDDYSRLVKVKNASSQLIKENKYNFKQ
ncbi:hypothetical protein [Chryseobacterium oranimense]|uniref:hypothetical protein n=1 Tax=Chryseobacterium oranimense TaxID=421058 RepID=UPI0031E30945